MEQVTAWTKFETHLLNEGLTKKRIDKLRSMFSIAERGLGVPYDKATRADIEAFLERLTRGTFKKDNGEAYGGSTKADLKKFIRQYFKWSRGNNEFYPPEVSWIKARIGKDERPKEKDIVSRDEVLAIANSFQKPEHRILTLLLFDSGFRIDEMLSVLKEGLTWEAIDDEGHKSWFIECKRSKTYPRKVDVGLFREDITTFANTTYFLNLKPGENLFPCNYDQYRMALAAATVRVTKKRITPHALRHSSATLYASLYRGDRVKLAERYGWSYAAQELDTYVRRSATRTKESAKIAYRDDLLTVQQENAELKQELANLKTQVAAIAASIIRTQRPEDIREARQIQKKKEKMRGGD